MLLEELFARIECRRGFSPVLTGSAEPARGKQQLLKLAGLQQDELPSPARSQARQDPAKPAGVAARALHRILATSVLSFVPALAKLLQFKISRSVALSKKDPFMDEVERPAE